MGSIATVWAWQQQTQTAKQKLLLLKIADQANDSGVAQGLTLRTVASDTGISKSALSRMAKELESAGLLTIQRTLRDDGANGPCVYQLALDEAVPSERNGGRPIQVGRGPSHLNGTQDQELKPKNLENLQTPAPARAGAVVAEHLAERRWSVKSKRPGKGPFVVDLDAGTCTCENRYPTECRHMRAAAIAEGQAEKVRKRLLRDAVWDALVDAFGKPPERQRAARGAVVSTLVEMLESDDVEQTPEAWAQEVSRRYRALAVDWGARKVTLHAFAMNWHQAGLPQVMVGTEPHAKVPRRFGRGMTVRQMLDQKDRLGKEAEGE